MHGRRPFLHALLAMPTALVGCSSRPQTPLAHLHGQQWVHGAYEHYAMTYHDIQTQAEHDTHKVYSVLAQKGIVALDGLQSREVPFYIRADSVGRRFLFERNLPERLTFTADMTEEDRARSTVVWKQAREHIHIDYDEIRRLGWALTSLLAQLQRIRGTVDQTQEEEFDITMQIEALGEGPPPFELPFQVSAKDYERVLLLLLERLDDDRHRLERIESAIVTVGLTMRATDANSGSLADNIRKVLVSVVEEEKDSPPRSSTFPQDRHDEFVAKGRSLYDEIRTGPAFAQWKKAKVAQQLEQVGSLLAILDSLTGIPTSAVFRQVINLWSGDDDYLSYLKVLVRIVPGGSLSSTLGQAIETTEHVRSASHQLRAIRDGASADPLNGVVNVGSGFARSRLERQLVFYRDAEEVATVKEVLAATELMRGVLPSIP